MESVTISDLCALLTGHFLDIFRDQIDDIRPFFQCGSSVFLLMGLKDTFIRYERFGVVGI
jgi:hypothetical protein